MTIALPAHQVLNSQLTSEIGKPVIQLEVLPVEVGARLNITFISTSGTWREGLRLAVDGRLDIAGTKADQFEVWTDTAPRSFEINVLETRDGLLRLYNVWDPGRGLKRESLKATSGMLREDRPDGSVVYQCNDIGLNPKFDKLVFELRLTGD